MPNGVPFCTGFSEEFDIRLTPITFPASVSSPVQTIAGGPLWIAELDESDYLQSLDAQENTRAAIKNDGTLWLWGGNSFAQLGNNSTLNHSSPVQTVSATTNWKQVSVGGAHSAAIKNDGTLWIWGSNLSSRLGTNTSESHSSPVQTVSATTNWKQVSLGNQHSAAIKTDGTLWLWGRGAEGMLGNSATSDRSSPVQTIACGNNWKQVSLGLCVSAAIKTDGTLWLWGLGTYGRLGTNNIISQSSPVQTVSATTNWKQVSVMCRHLAAVKTDGTLWLWGYGTSGALGNNSTLNQSSPVQTISCGTDWKQVSVSNRTSASIKTDGTLWLWGEAGSGELGNNATTDRSSPVQTISSGNDWALVSLGSSPGVTGAASIKTDATLWVWGTNADGLLGLAPPTETTCFVDLGTQLVEKEYLIDVYPNLVPWVKSPSLWLWGDGGSGRLGDNSTINKSSPVQTISNGSNWKQVSLGSSHSAAIKTDGTLWLWGAGGSGQLGNNALTSRSSPVQTFSCGTNWKQVSLGSSHSAAVKTDGTLWLWGSDADGNGILGTNSIVDQSSPVQTVSATANWKQVSLGSSHSAAIKTDGTLWLWGNSNGGRLGNNEAGDSPPCRSSPVQTVSTGTNWKQVSLGSSHSAAIKTDGTLWVWGGNGSGNLGNNSVSGQSSPVQTISLGINWKQVSLGSSLSSAIKVDGTLWLWGAGGSGELGNNSTINRSSPVQTIASNNNWKDVAAGGSFSAAIYETYDW